MSYYDANKCFNENLQLTSEEDREKQIKNLNNGLLLLSDAVQHDLSQIRRALQYLNDELKVRG